MRHHGDVGLVELPPTAFEEAQIRRSDIVDAVRAAGFRFVGLDLEGLESGRLNRVHREQVAR